MTIYSRLDRAVLKFSGKDAQKLLNDVVTGPVAAEAGPARWWALLSAQGKIQAEGLIGWAEDAFWLDVHNSVADSFIKRMKMYRLRADMAIEDLRESHRLGWSAGPVDDGIVHADGRAAGLGFRVIADTGSAAGWATDAAVYDRARIAHGIAELGPDFALDTTFPHDIGMDLLNGVDFKKGCFIGQEVVSRMQHRGTARRRPVLVSGIDAEASGPVMLGAREVGALGAVLDGQSVAVLRIDRIADATAVTVADKPVTLALPSWASYSFGESVPAD
ncbi:MAG TPA: folate-binding protein [Arsenicitalea sp.]|nr:folate-binding protein [Arsenicitalea sp.]